MKKEVQVSCGSVVLLRELFFISQRTLVALLSAERALPEQPRTREAKAKVEQRQELSERQSEPEVEVGLSAASNCGISTKEEEEEEQRPERVNC